MLPDGSSLSDRINAMLEPGWKKAMAEGKDPSGNHCIFTVLSCRKDRSLTFILQVSLS
jgi:hypothetical protein